VTSSREFALAIRARQELTKRLVALGPAPRWVGVGSLLPLLEPTSELRRHAAHPPDLARVMSELASQRYPSKHLATRPRATLPASDALLADVARVERGQWEFFGTPFQNQASAIDWNVHPATDARYPQVPWHRLPLIGAIPGDVKYVWELNRHHELVRLAQGYALSGDEALATRIRDLLWRWMDQNPPGRGVNWASSLEVSYRAIAWCWIWHLTRTSPVWQSELLPRFLWSLWHHARHIERYDSIHHSPNTHLTGEALGLLYVGLFFPEFRRAARWATAGERLLDSELQYQVLPDGMHFERATGYHRYTVEIYTHCALLSRAYGLPISDRVQEALERMLRASQALARPDGSWPIVGDEDSGAVLRVTVSSPDDQRPMLAVNAGLLNERQWSLGVDAPARAAGWWLLDDLSWHRLASMPATELPAGTFALESAGYYGIREQGSRRGWFCLVDAGPHGGDSTGHAHTDLGHVEIARGDVRVVADPGTSSYTADPAARDRERSEQSHGCLVVAEAPLARPRGPFAWDSVAVTPRAKSGRDDGAWWCELTYTRPTNTSASIVRHRRVVVLVPSFGVVVCDEIVAPTGARASIHWPIPHPTEAFVRHDHSIEGPGFGIAWAANATAGAIDSSLEPTWYSPAYGERRPASVLRLSPSKTESSIVVTSFSEQAAEVVLDRAAERTATISSGDVQICVSFDAGGPPRVQRTVLESGSQRRRHSTPVVP